MPGLSSLLAEILPPLPPPGDLLAWSAPVLALAALGWLVSRTDRIIHQAFPDLEWERNLGWLNIQAERRAHRAMRWVGYGIVVLLLDSLVGILWAVKDFPRLADWADPWVMGELALRIPALGVCLLIWVIYLGCGLLPRLRAEREAAAFRRFRAEMQTQDEELEMASPSRIPAVRRETRTSPETATHLSSRDRRRHPPGG